MTCNEHLFERAARNARAEGDYDAADTLGSPEGRAAWLVTCTERMVPEGDTAVGFDILPGECHPVSRSLTHPGAFGNAAEVTGSMAHQARTLIRLGIEHGHTVCGVPRESVGCCTLFVTRTPRDVVSGVTETKDCAPARNAVTLAPRGGELSVSPRVAEAAREEREAYANLVEARARAQSRQEAASRTRGEGNGASDRASHTRDALAPFGADGGDAGGGGANDDGSNARRARRASRPDDAPLAG